MPTLGEIRSSLERASAHADGRASNTCILRPCAVPNIVELDPHLVLKALDQIELAITTVKGGLTSPSDHTAEILLLQIFDEHAKLGKKFDSHGAHSNHI